MREKERDIGLQTQLELLIDSSHTSLTGRNTGIERVVRSLMLHLPSITDNPVKPVIHIHDDFYSIDRDLEPKLAQTRRFEAQAVQSLPGFLRRSLQLVCRLPGLSRFQSALLPKPSHLGIMKVPFQLHVNRLVRQRTRRSGPMAMTSNSILLLPDAYWVKRRIWPSVADARSKGATICSVVYDLIPISHPHFVGQKRSEKVRRYIDALLRHSDVVVTISKTVANELAQYISSNYADAEPVCRDIRSFRLGADFTIADGKVRDSVKDLFLTREESPFLVVGSLDPRKNHHQVLDAFEVLWKKSSALKLCFIGRSGGLSDPLVSRIESHPELGKRFFWLHDMTDSELQWAYQNTRGVIMPSVVEGFGLPIVESLAFGAPTMASDIPIHREVGGEHCNYFPLGDVPSLVRQVEDQASRDRNALSRPRLTPTTWGQSADQLHGICVEVHHKKQRGVLAAA